MITLHFGTPHYILQLWVRRPLQPLENRNHLSVHQWIRSAIHASQQLTAPIVSPPHQLVDKSLQTMLCLCNVYTSKANTNTQVSFQTIVIDFIIQSVLLIRPTIEAEAFRSSTMAICRRFSSFNTEMSAWLHPAIQVVCKCACAHAVYRYARFACM